MQVQGIQEKNDYFVSLFCLHVFYNSDFKIYCKRNALRAIIRYTKEA